ncbi:purine-cytosine permease family protein [Tengunoibacter tsumagoiensis]|uniref:Cytosine permease n=1 Tax=Tengunoibacter tsumagoiensis TaxID=2014871 RepID=A0A401ZYL4_9CHLR|nr:cytosine permease [Tengunoibacter tsumagoiensis]GCE11923.1 cytosine permease [Tengunoibacter tsumagoiensis]
MATETVVTAEQELGIETRGIERVSPKSRTHVRIFDNFTTWLSANLVISTVAVGALAVPVFGLGFWQSILAILLFNILGVLPVAFFSTLGPKLGLRQMTISRFSFGWVGAIVMALFNIAACIGWSAVNVIVGGQLVSALSNGAIPSWVGIIVIAIVTTIVSIYGYKFVHAYERYAWIPMALIFVILMVIAGPHVTIVPPPAYSFATIASFVSFGGAVYGFATGWSSYASDYTVNQPEETSAARVFWLTFLGVTIPCILLEIMGMALTTGYKGNGAGDLLSAVLQPWGVAGKLLLVLLALSVIANNIPNDYSLGLTMQVLGRSFQYVNRAVWTLIGAVIYIAIAIPASANYNGTLENFLLLIAYWLGPWAIILVIEHFFFRRGSYNVDDWNTASKLPQGWAALIAMAAGLVGVYLGAAQLLFVGPIAYWLGGKYGIDIGFELGVVFAAVVYVILRSVERRTAGR